MQIHEVIQEKNPCFFRWIFIHQNGFLELRFTLNLLISFSYITVHMNGIEHSKYLLDLRLSNLMKSTTYKNDVNEFRRCIT